MVSRYREQDDESLMQTLAPNNGPNTVVKCRGIETDHLGAIGMQHCDAQVTDCNGAPVITIKRRCAPFIHSFIVDEWESINSTDTVSPKLY
jgi:hypothetical protein